ncbi:alpha/beta hydrolase [Dyella nitratireducens]|uniref:Esterase n=1 Tax=Dyella nitratireducens TaxID=1849580 RepID=A0ABQ1G9P8_9GAMM|nr:alpha/beta fold hydrolase [Dyella nitratireducens]GGA39429.1 esterase [Dyella nitratireducens]GLQ40439.1 esterase [Dyella nitratireducens]
MRKRQISNWLFFLALMASLALVGLWVAGSYLISPMQSFVGAPPSDLPAQAIVFPDASGEPIHGWFVAGTKGQGAVLLLHGVRADRRAMINRARFLHAAGYAVLLIDFQAAGESPGKAITFGYREAEDVKASLRYIHQRLPGEHVGVIGTSMGGAATILAEPDVDADAVVLEQVYPTIQQATEDRLAIHLGPIGPWLAPVLLMTLHAHLDIYPDQLRPIEHIGHLSMPKLLIVGDRDRDTTMAESYAMFHAATGSKQLWVVHGARHVDLYGYVGADYQVRVLDFFNTCLRGK